MALTDLGFVRRNYKEILDDKIQRAKELFGEDIDTSDQTPLGKFIRINAYDQAIAEEEIEGVYYARFPNTASGNSLDRLLVFGGISRNPAEAATYSVQITGTAWHILSAGFLVGTDTDLTFYTVEAARIGSDGKCTVTVCCTTPGTIGNINASAINKAINPDADVASVTGLECITIGRDEESDADLRERLKSAISGAGSCNVNAIRSALLRVPTVQFADVIENDTDAEDGDGRPPHSFECYVVGGENYLHEIGETIFKKRPVGIQTVGDKSVTITDISGNTRTVKYSNPETIRVNVRVNVKTNTSFQANGPELIQANVTNYINALGIGKSLVLNTLYSHIYKVTGVSEVVTLERSTDDGATYSSSNVTIPQFGVALCAGVDVEVAT